MDSKTASNLATFSSTEAEFKPLESVGPKKLATVKFHRRK
jgi:hypothetical protein